MSSFASIGEDVLPAAAIARRKFARTDDQRFGVKRFDEKVGHGLAGGGQTSHDDVSFYGGILSQEKLLPCFAQI